MRGYDAQAMVDAYLASSYPDVRAATAAAVQGCPQLTSVPVLTHPRGAS